MMKNGDVMTLEAQKFFEEVATLEGDPHTISRALRSGSGGKGAWGRVWYQ